jgi:cell division protein DivIC
MKRFKSILRKIIPFFRNFYFTTGLLLLVWVTFFDANDFISQFQLTSKMNDLEAEKVYYLSKIEEVKFEKKELFSTPALLEKFARERYLMKKPTEDQYILAKD